MKMEEQSSTDAMREAKAPHILQAGNIREFLEMMSGEQIKQEPRESPLHLWESQWQKFLKMVEGSSPAWGAPLCLEKSSAWDDAKAFLASFEQVAETCQWPRDEWGIRLLPAIKGDVEQAFRWLQVKDREDYGKVKAAILREDALNREKIRRHFRHFHYLEAEGPRKAYIRLQELGCRWLKSERHSKEQIVEMLILEQLLSVLPSEMQKWVQKHGPETCFQAVALAEEFLSQQKVAQGHEDQVSFGEPTDCSSEAGGTPTLVEEKKLWMATEQEGDGQRLKLSAKVGTAINSEEVNIPEDSHTNRRHGTLLWKTEKNFPPCCIQENNPATQERPECQHEAHHLMEEGNDVIPPRGTFQIPIETPATNQIGAATGREQNVHHSYTKTAGIPSRIQLEGKDCPPMQRWEKYVQERLAQLLQFPCGRDGGSSSVRLEPKMASKWREATERPQRTHPGEKTYGPVIPQEGGQGPKEARERTDDGPQFEKTKEPFSHECAQEAEERGGNLLAPGVSTSSQVKAPQNLSPGPSCRQSQDLLSPPIQPEKKPYTCPECGKSYTYRSHFRIHERFHKQERPFSCSKCPKKFYQNCDLLRHQRLHTRAMTFICSMCGKFFSSHAVFMMHQNTHRAEENPFRCSQCERDFNDKSSLDKHQDSHRVETS